MAEAAEALVLLESTLVELEAGTVPAARIAQVFRGMHSIKGTAGFFGFEQVAALTHVGESVMARLRDETLEVTSDVADALMELADGVRLHIEALARTGKEADAEHHDLVRTLDALASSPVACGRPGPDVSPETLSGGAVHPVADPAELSVGGAVDCEVASSAGVNSSGSSPRSTEIVESGGLGGDSSVRIDVALVDKLLNLAGELVLSRNRIVNLHAASRDSAATAVTQDLSRVTTELHELVMKVRLQPIHSLWNRFPRLIRDVARDCDKRVRLVMRGEETELDRALLDAMRDPLTHVLRNAVDHGIETPEERRLAGKEEQGSVALSAYQQGGYVFIRVEDDGKGLHPDRLKARAVERELITAEDAQLMDDRDAIQLIFKAGFSTAATVTRISGRGVGMDVVKSNVERVGGAVEVSSKPGRGTVLSIKLPLTLAIVPALVVHTAGVLFAIPQASVVEVMHTTDEVRVESIGETSVLRLRGELLPLAVLSQISEPGENRKAGDSVVIVAADGRRFGVVVDGIVDTEEIVVKPLGHELRTVPLFAGAAVLGTGAIVLVLDVSAVARSASISIEARSETSHGSTSSLATRDDALLVVSTDGEDRIALPLSAIHRVDRVARVRMERAGSRVVMQYHGKLLPVRSLAVALGRMDQREKHEEFLAVLVLNGRSDQVAFVIDRIIDVVPQAEALDEGVDGTPISGTAVLAGSVTELLSVDRLLSVANDNRSAA